MITKGPRLKIFARDDSQKSTEFNSFSNYAKSPDDEIRLFISQGDLSFILDKLAWSGLNTQIGHNFLQRISESYDSTSFRLSYILALEAVNDISNVAIEKYKQFENRSAQIQLKDINPKSICNIPATKDDALSFREFNRLLSILLSLEDQLWAMTQSSEVD